MEVKTSILEMAKGAIQERVDYEIAKIIDNILDMNTEAAKKRTLVLNVDLTPDADRKAISVSATARCKLQPTNAVSTALYLDGNPMSGEVTAYELVPNIPGQMDLDGEEQGKPKILKIAR